MGVVGDWGIPINPMINEDEIGKAHANERISQLIGARRVTSKTNTQPRQHRLERHGHTYKPRYFYAGAVPV
jgi:hypothetical protein